MPRASPSEIGRDEKINKGGSGGERKIESWRFSVLHDRITDYACSLSSMTL